MLHPKLVKFLYVIGMTELTAYQVNRYEAKYHEAKCDAKTDASGHLSKKRGATIIKTEKNPL